MSRCNFNKNVYTKSPGLKKKMFVKYWKKTYERMIMWSESFVQKTGFEVGIYTFFLGNGDFSIKCFIEIMKQNLDRNLFIKLKKPSFDRIIYIRQQINF